MSSAAAGMLPSCGSFETAGAEIGLRGQGERAGRRVREEGRAVWTVWWLGAWASRRGYESVGRAGGGGGAGRSAENGGVG
eukprot:7094750-Prymnesium_polylepis.1